MIQALFGMRSAAVPAFLALWWTAANGAAAPASPPRAKSSTKPALPAETRGGDTRQTTPPVQTGCTLEVEGGPRGGITVNDDQWILGGHLRLGFLCLGGFTIESVALLGFGGNYLTLRPSLRGIYRLYSDTNRELELHPTLGYSLVQWIPVGRFAEWCSRLEVDACYARDGGVELGGGIAYRFIGLDAVAGFGTLPIVTITLMATFPIAKGGW
jgi:hypothetical protein